MAWLGNAGRGDFGWPLPWRTQLRAQLEQLILGLVVTDFRETTHQHSFVLLYLIAVDANLLLVHEQVFVGNGLLIECVEQEM